MKQAARSGFCFVLVLGMKLCTHDCAAQLCPQTSATVESQFLLGFISFFSPVSLDFVFLQSTYLCLSRSHTYQQEQEVAVESCSGSGLWLQAGHSVADGEAFMRRPLESPRSDCFASTCGFQQRKTVGHGFKFHRPLTSIPLPCTEQTREHTR